MVPLLEIFKTLETVSHSTAFLGALLLGIAFLWKAYRQCQKELFSLSSEAVQHMAKQTVLTEQILTELRK